MVVIIATKGDETEKLEYLGMSYAMMTVADFVSRGYTVTISEER